MECLWWGKYLYQELFVSLYEAAVAGNTAEAERLHATVMKICEQIYRIAESRCSLG